MRLSMIAGAAFIVACAPRAAEQHLAIYPFNSSQSIVPAADEQTRTFLGASIEADKLYLEVPVSLLGKDMLIYQEQQRDQGVVRWERRGTRLLLIRPEVTFAAETNAPRNVVSRRGDLPAIVAAFPIESERSSSGLVVDVARLFTTAVPGFVGASDATDPARSFVETVAVYPDNVEIDAVLTSAAPPAEAGSSGTRRLHWSLVRLPDDLMRPRLYDPRIGFWMETYLSEPKADYAAAERGSIVRWRLEKKDTELAVSEPIKPITFFIDPATPDKWRPWVRRGVEAWQKAFEAAGFKNAIIARDPPDDATWSVDDVRHSVVRWYARPQRGSGGSMGTASTVVDPRTGEILKANAYVGENFDAGRDWYFTMAAPLDVRAQQLPFPDSLQGALYQSLVSHEVGHALGIRDGAYGKLAYPVDSLRSTNWLRKMGFTPSIMNYSRFNYVAQPEDSIPVDLLLPSIGPADEHTIRWGYSPIPGARSPEEEKPILESWVQVQDTTPWLRFVGMPHELYTASDASDDAEPVRSAELGISNLRRVVQILPRAALSPGSDNRLLEHLYARVLRQWFNETSRVVGLIGGSTVQMKLGSQPGPVHTPVPAAEQRSAIGFLDSMAFRTQAWLLQPEVTRRFQSQGAVPAVMRMQNALLARVLSSERFDRIAEAEITATTSGEVYSRAELLADLRRGLWQELSAQRVLIADPMRRDLQRTHLMLLISPLKGLGNATVTPHDVEYNRPARPTSYDVFYTELITLQREIERALPRVTEPATRSHLHLMRKLIKGAMNDGSPARPSW